MYRVPKATNNDDRDALDEFEKASKSGDSKHFRRLLKETFEIRRKYIQNEAKTITEIVQKYPYFQLSDLVSIFELYFFY